MLRLKELRKQRKLSQKEVADYLEITQVQVSKYELGKNEPDLKTLLRLAEYFNVSIDYLLGASLEDIIVLTKQDYNEIKTAAKILEKITNKLDNQRQTINQSNNIQIGDHNSISNSFNKK